MPELAYPYDPDRPVKLRPLSALAGYMLAVADTDVAVASDADVEASLFEFERVKLPVTPPSRSRAYRDSEEDTVDVPPSVLREPSSSSRHLALIMTVY